METPKPHKKGEAFSLLQKIDWIEKNPEIGRFILSGFEEIKESLEEMLEKRKRKERMVLENRLSID